MSDVTVAPNASPPPTNEAVINQSPVSTPQPIGSQAPQKQGEQPSSRADSRRETIQRAFEKAQNAKPAQARMGHNNPPEPMEREAQKEKPKPPPLDLRKRPSEQPRAEHGHYAPRQGGQTYAGTSGSPQERSGQEQPQRSYQQLPDHAPYREPPQRMTDRGKQDWHGTPESVRADFHRMHREFDNGFRRFRGDHEVMKTIRPFHEMATQHGTTLQRALSNYVGMEHKLRSDVVGGLDVIVNNLNLRTPEGQKLTLRDIAWHILNQSPDQHKLLQTQNAQNAQTHQIGQLHQMVNTLAKGIHQMQYERQYTNTRSALDQYADSHPRFDELGDLIEQEIKLGFDLDTAYRRAERLRPATAAQTRNGHGSAAQTRTSDRSIHGAPDAGPSNGTSRRNGKPIGRRDAIEKAIKRVNGSL